MKDPAYSRAIYPRFGYAMKSSPASRLMSFAPGAKEKDNFKELLAFRLRMSAARIHRGLSSSGDTQTTHAALVLRRQRTSRARTRRRRLWLPALRSWKGRCARSCSVEWTWRLLDGGREAEISLARLAEVPATATTAARCAPTAATSATAAGATAAGDAAAGVAAASGHAATTSPTSRSTATTSDAATSHAASRHAAAGLATASYVAAAVTPATDHAAAGDATASHAGWHATHATGVAINGCNEAVRSLAIRGHRELSPWD